MDWVLMADLSSTLALAKTILYVAGGLGFVIFVHELGHFLAAKACGVKCEKFYIGFDIPLPFGLPSSLCRFRWGETEYGIGVLPLGGYVKMLGQDDNPAAQARENERIKVRKGEAADLSADGVADGDQLRASADSGETARAETVTAADGEDEDYELDPRSYPARPVWQRMIIISAGVVMNLIFAVIFATIAYDMGVSYVPCVISGTATGNPAWVAGWEPGDQILQLRRDGAPDEHLRFEKDLMVGVILNGANREMELLVRQEGTGEERWYTVVPSGRRIGPHKRATLGVFGPRIARLDATMPIVSLAGQEDLSKKFVGGEEILAVDGEPLPRDERTGQVLGHHVDAYLADRMDQTLTLTVSRPLPSDSAGASASGETLEIAVPPTRLRMTGLVMQAGPIAAVRTGSPADEAGIKEGDRLLRLAGEDIGDPLTLAQRMLDHIGEEIEIQVERAGQPRSFQVRPVPPKMYDDNVGPGTLVGLESLGIALPVDSIVLDVQPGSPGEKAKIQPGDRIVSIQFLSDGEKDGDPVVMSEVDADQRLVSVPNWCYAHHAVQQSESFTLEVVVHRPSSPPTNDGGQPQAIPLDGELETLAPMLLEPELSEQWFYPQRGIRLEQLTEIRTAGSIGESLSLGWRETKSSLIQVVLVLQRLFTGQISVRSMGGPLTIAAAAGTEASKGLPRLLIFLTFLSANLAVLNFLPIPALDGGHMVFLAAEGIRGKPVNERVQITLTLVGVACLLSLMLLVFTNDLQFLFFR